MKVPSFLTVLLFATLPLLSQPAIQWENTIGGNASEYLRALQQTSDGGYILGGYSASGISGDKTESAQADDYWVVKLDAAGNISWQNTIGGNSFDRLYAMEQTADGGYILCGSSNSGISGDKTQGSKGGYDFWIVKLDATGNISWQKTIGGSGIDDGTYALTQTSDGGYLAGCSSLSNISGDKTENSNGSYDWWVVRLNSTGGILWQNTIGGSSFDHLFSARQTTDGGFILGGSSTSNISGDKTENSQGGEDYWVIKLDAAGSISWQNTIGGNGIDRLQDVRQTNDGGYILGGYSNSGISGDKSEPSFGDYKYWVVKLDATGNISWENTIGGNGSDHLYSIRQTADSSYILVGQSDSNIYGDKTENNRGASDYWVVKLGYGGSIIWQKTIGGNSFEAEPVICETTDGGYFLGGRSWSNASGEKSENSWGLYDYWVVKLAPCSTEVCDGLDNDCDGLVDEGFDFDNDGYKICQNDCNDNNAAINPGAAEVCDNGLDDNCDGLTDVFSLLTLQDLTNFFNAGVASGTINAANGGGQLTAFSNNLANGNLQWCLDRCDGQSPPPDFLAGSGVATLNGMIAQFIANQACSNGIPLLAPPGGGKVATSQQLDDTSLENGRPGSRSSKAAGSPTGSFHLYPNPATNTLYLDLHDYLEQELSITIFNHLGQQVLHLPEREVYEPVLGIDTERIPNGVYLLGIKSREGRISKLFSIQR